MNDDLEKIITPLLPEKTIILGWYDGIVCALVHSNSIDKWCMINLEAWDLDHESKVYTLKILSEQENNQVLKILESHKPSWPIWTPKIPSEFDKLGSILDRKNSEYYVFLANDINRGIPSMKRIFIDEKYRKDDIEGIFSMTKEEKNFWYSLI